MSQLQKSFRNPPRPSAVAQGAMADKSATPPKEGIFLPKARSEASERADPPLAERGLGYDPLPGGVREAGGWV